LFFLKRNDDLGIAAYYYLIVQPFFTGQVISFGFIK